MCQLQLPTALDRLEKYSSAATYIYARYFSKDILNMYYLLNTFLTVIYYYFVHFFINFQINNSKSFNFTQRKSSS